MAKALSWGVLNFGPSKRLEIAFPALKMRDKLHVYRTKNTQIDRQTLFYSKKKHLRDPQIDRRTSFFSKKKHNK